MTGVGAKLTPFFYSIYSIYSIYSNYNIYRCYDLQQIFVGRMC